MDICPKDEPTAKTLVCQNALPIPEKNWKNLLGGGVASIPPGHWRVKIENADISSQNFDKLNQNENLKLQTKLFDM